MAGKRVTITPGRPTPPSTADDWVTGGAEEAAKVATEPTKRLTIDLPASLHTRLKVECAKAGKTMADFIRDLIEQGLS